MQVTVIDPREKFSTSPRELETLAIDPVAPLFPGQKKPRSIPFSLFEHRFKKSSRVTKSKTWLDTRFSFQIHDKSAHCSPLRYRLRRITQLRKQDMQN